MMLQGRGTSRGTSALVAVAALLAIAPATASAAVPVNTLPGDQTTNEDTAKTFAISVADGDDPASIQVTLTAANGTMTLATTAGLTFSRPRRQRPAGR